MYRLSTKFLLFFILFLIDSGASPDEAISWGKIRITAKPVKLVCEVTLVLPLIVGKTFYEAAKKFAEYYKQKS